MKYIHCFLLISLFTILLVSCNDVQIFHERKIEEIKDIAQHQNKTFCIILVQDNCSSCKFFLTSLLNNHKDDILSKTIINIVDT